MESSGGVERAGSLFKEFAIEPRCEACLSTDIKHHPKSRLSGSVIYQCRQCGLRGLSTRPLMEDLAEFATTYDRDRYAEWVSITRTGQIDRDHAAVLERINQLVGPKDDRSLFDVGAGSGGFLSMARDAGFRPAGNDLSNGAVDLARESHDIDLMLGDLADIDDPGQHDVVTLWCVLAHVPDGSTLMRDVLRVLKPGGLMYLQTPRWSAMDTMGMAAQDVARGRATKITDRRLGMHHMVLHTADSIRALLERLGYEIVAVEPHVRYTLTTASYLESLGFNERWRRRLGKPIDGLLDRDLFFRNVLDVYARRPLDS
jgi:2-polyprenyl-3-methyl-5-hydroxy-6-metoxy-1,4-benzoquinol methylase